MAYQVFCTWTACLKNEKKWNYREYKWEKKKKLHILWNYNVTNVTYTICYPLLRDNNNRKTKTGQIPITHHIHEFPAMISIKTVPSSPFLFLFIFQMISISFFAFTFLRLSSRKKIERCCTERGQWGRDLHIRYKHIQINNMTFAWIYIILLLNS